MRYSAHCPVRLDLSGYWTTMPAFAQRHGGSAVTAAIQPYVAGTISRPRHDSILHALRGDRHHLSYTLDLPRGSGLGASAAQTVLWTALTKTVIADVSDRLHIAHIAASIEVMLGAGGTAIDSFACALGGWAHFDVTDSVAVETLPRELDRPDSLERNLLLVYTGAAPPSAGIINSIAERYASGSTRIASTLSRMKSLARQMREMARSGDFDAVADVMRSEWELQKQLDERISNPTVDAILNLGLDNGAAGGRLCGAGGGGFLLLLVQPGQRARLRTVFRTRNLPTLEVQFDDYGVHLGNPDAP